jgi:PAS domain S-box-containing protein
LSRSDSVYFKDKNCKFIKVNKAKAEHSNVTPDKMLGKTDFDFLPEDEAKNIHQDDTNIMLTGEPMINKTEKLTDKDGNVRWVSVNKIPRYNKKGEVIGTMGISRDITDFKKEEEKSNFLSKTAMELNQFPVEEDIYGYIGNKIHDLASNAFICISLFNDKKNKFEINRTYGFDKKIENIDEIEDEGDVIGFNLNFSDEEWKKNILNGDLVKVSKEEFKKLQSQQSKKVCQSIKKSMNEDEIYTMGLVKDGKIFGNVLIIAYKSHLIENIDTIQTFVNQAAVAVQRNSAMRQLTDLNKNLEKKVKERTVEVEKLLKQKDEFIGQLGHDLKNPMVPLTTLLPIVKERQKDPKSQELLEAVLKNVDYMKNLVVDTLVLTQLNSPNTKLDIENVNLSDEIKKAIVNNKVILEKKKIKIDNSVKNNLVVQADKLRILELFDNLIDNAVKYSSEGDKITINAEENEDTVTVTVSDVGIGISEEQMNHIFDEFYKGDESRSNFESCGLGLPICKRIVEKHGGQIWVESPGKDKGAKFYFTLKTAGKK